MDYLKKEEPMHCLECGHEIPYGRGNKRFCDSKCKNKWHNRQTRDARIIHNRTLSGINKNYQILMKLVRMGVKTIDLDAVMALGFNPYITTGYRKKERRNEYRCYEFQYYLSDTKVFGICQVELLGDDPTH